MNSWDFFYLMLCVNNMLFYAYLHTFQPHCTMTQTKGKIGGLVKNHWTWDWFPVNGNKGLYIFLNPHFVSNVLEPKESLSGLDVTLWNTTLWKKFLKIHNFFGQNFQSIFSYHEKIIFLKIRPKTAFGGSKNR